MKMVQTPSPRKKRTHGRRQEQPPGTGHPARTPDIRPLEIYTARTLQKKLQGPDIRRPARTSGVRPGHPPLLTGNPAKIPDIWHWRLGSTEGCPVSPDIRPAPRTSGASRSNGHPAPPSGHPASPIRRIERPSAPARTSGPSAWTSGPSRATGHPARRPDIRPSLSAHSVGPRPMYPSSPLDYIYSIPTYVLGSALG